MSKQTSNRIRSLTFSGIITAFGVICLTLARVTPTAFAMPAAAGVFLIVIMAELGVKWSLLVYAATSALGFLLGDRSAWIFYLIFFGAYSILKAVLERIPQRILEFAAKLALFNAATALICSLVGQFIPLPDFFENLGGFLIPALVFAGNLFFLIYDFALSCLARFYGTKIRPRLPGLTR